MTDTVAEDVAGTATGSGSSKDAIGRLVDQAQAEGLSLTGPGGLLGELTKRVLESALEGELDGHLGYAKHDPAGHNSGNSRNGHRTKTVLTETGPVDIEVPRDRDSSFEPTIVRKRQSRLTGVDDLVVSLSAKQHGGEEGAHERVDGLLGLVSGELVGDLGGFDERVVSGARHRAVAGAASYLDVEPHHPPLGDIDDVGACIAEPHWESAALVDDIWCGQGLWSCLE